MLFSAKAVSLSHLEPSRTAVLLCRGGLPGVLEATHLCPKALTLRAGRALGAQ